MNLPLFIAKRYLISKKSRQAINIITLISVIGVTVGTAGLIIVLSVFNGFEELILSLYNSFDPDIKIESNTGKTFSLAALPLDKIRKINSVKYCTKSLEENGLVKYRDRQYLATIKGVSEDFRLMTGIDSMITDGSFVLREKNVNFAVPGRSIADALGLSTKDIFTPLDIYLPQKGKQASLNPMEAFHNELLPPSGVFSIQQDFDSKYVLVPLEMMQRLTGTENTVSSIELGIYPHERADLVCDSLKKILGNRYKIRNREQQHELLYKIMKSEKWAVYLILSFILTVATFNIVGSLTMLILDKKEDIQILWCMGAEISLLKRVFLLEGLIISFCGGGAGLLLGLLICQLQKAFGLVKMGGSFVIDAYPVSLRLLDFTYVGATVLIIGFAAAYYPSQKMLSPKGLSNAL